MHLDDILVVSQDRDHHLEHLHVVLDLMVWNGLVLNLEICSFAQKKTDYLEHKISPAVIIPLHPHVDALLLQPRSQDLSGLQRILGMVNFYRCFLPLRPLIDAQALLIIRYNVINVNVNLSFRYPVL